MRVPHHAHSPPADSFNFSKFTRECPDLLDKLLNPTEVDLIFVKCKAKTARRLTYGQFLDALSAMATVKYHDIDGACRCHAQLHRSRIYAAFPSTAYPPCRPQIPRLPSPCCWPITCSSVQPASASQRHSDRAYSIWSLSPGPVVAGAAAALPLSMPPPCLHQLRRLVAARHHRRWPEHHLHVAVASHQPPVAPH